MAKLVKKVVKVSKPTPIVNEEVVIQEVTPEVKEVVIETLISPEAKFDELVSKLVISKIGQGLQGLLTPQEAKAIFNSAIK